MVPLVAHVMDLQGGKEEEFAFLKSPVRIGRGELNDLPLPKGFVSTYHGLIQFDDEEARYLDLGSTNGSVLNGVRLSANAPVALEAGAELSIGTYQLTFERRVTGEQAPLPRQTMFAVRAATLSGLRARPERAPAAALVALALEAQPEPAPPEVAPRPLSAPGPSEAALAEAEAAVDAAALDLDLDYASYRGSWDHLRHNLEAVVSPLGSEARQAALDRLSAKYAALLQEPQFAALTGARAEPPAERAEAVALAPPPATDGGLGDASLRFLRAFGDSYLPRAPSLGSPAEIEAVLGRVAGALETFARSFLELRRGYEEFGREMGVRTVQVEGPLLRARDPAQVLAYLLDPASQGRDAELQRAFADFMIHQVALLRGVVDGARALLAQLSPEAVASTAPASVWPLRAVNLWKVFEQRFHDLADEESSISEVLFGREFARAYVSMAGQPAPPPGDGEASDATGRPGTP